MQERSGGTRLGTYLRRLRENYGYTLRRVEQRSQAVGECIDNSQLSRFEKGKACPSFEKLRVLARVFNIPVQNFSDMLDLEVYDQYKPEGTNYDHLMEEGARDFDLGNFGKAYVTFERCLEILENGSTVDLAERRARARTRMAIALKRLGKLSMTESELRSILREPAGLSAQTRIRTLLQLASVNRELGDRYLAGILVRECLDLSRNERDRPSEAAARQILGNLLLEDGNPAGAVPHLEAALGLWENLGEERKKVALLATLGECQCLLDRGDNGWANLKKSLALARRLSDRRGTAYALHKMAAASLREGRAGEGQDFIAKSNLEAEREPDPYPDILFANTFLMWEEARKRRNTTQAKIAFGRLKHLRSALEQRSPEVDRFDEYLGRSSGHGA
ncbi:MAG: helix-turn-helix transcriptional regulator [Acidobacteria bacterium]|nr:helix-turn-helix transcriptional regulator [Acidobacteriota bacterium]